ncbi:hypothetical protein JVU11DRAFT_3612 [Chiua virens]|nr:hypothetical protein JVU11DRAFT_3612 [Chiua virens]
MEDIMVGGVATGAYAFQGGAVQPQVTEPDEDDTNDATTGTLPAVTPRSSGPSVADPTQQLIINAITSTVAAINSFASGTSPSSFPGPPTHSLASFPPRSSPQSSNNAKRPLSSLSPDETDRSLLFSPEPPTSTATTSSIVMRDARSKHSRTSASPSVVDGATGRSVVGHSTAGRSIGGNSAIGQKNTTSKNTTSIALQQVNSSICHLGDSINKSFVDPLNVIKDVIPVITTLGDKMPTEHKTLYLYTVRISSTLAFL